MNTTNKSSLSRLLDRLTADLDKVAEDAYFYFLEGEPVVLEYPSTPAYPGSLHSKGVSRLLFAAAFSRVYKAAVRAQKKTGAFGVFTSRSTGGDITVELYYD